MLVFSDGQNLHVKDNHPHIHATLATQGEFSK